MKPKLLNQLLYTNISICYKDSKIDIDNILIDTGSSSTVFSADIISKIGIKPEATDPIKTIRGVGGIEIVFCRTVDYLQVNDFQMNNFEIEIAGMDYGLEINGILGMDFLIPSKANLNLKTLEINFD